MSQVSVRIASPIFTKRGPWPRTSIKEYTAAPGDVNTLKTNLGLADNSISVSALISVDRDGEISGSSYSLSGQGLSSWHVGYRADRIFQGASDAVNVELNIPAEAWRFEKGGETKNVSEWLDAAPYWKISMDNNVLSPDQIQKLTGLKKGLCLRMVLMPTSSKQCSAQVVYFPASKAALKEITDKKQIREGSLAIPVGRLAFGKHQVCLYPFFPLEAQEQNIGLGVLPLLEMVSGRDADPKVPTRDMLEEELCELLGNSTVLPKVHNSPEELYTAIKEKSWAIQTTEKPMYWPGYKGPSVAEEPTDAGNYVFIFTRQSVSQSVTSHDPGPEEVRRHGGVENLGSGCPCSLQLASGDV